MTHTSLCCHWNSLSHCLQVLPVFLLSHIVGYQSDSYGHLSLNVNVNKTLYCSPYVFCFSTNCWWVHTRFWSGLRVLWFVLRLQYIHEYLLLFLLFRNLVLKFWVGFSISVCNIVYVAVMLLMCWVGSVGMFFCLCSFFAYFDLLLSNTVRCSLSVVIFVFFVSILICYTILVSLYVS